jgi:hypothetical protein
VCFDSANSFELFRYSFSTKLSFCSILVFFLVQEWGDQIGLREGRCYGRGVVLERGDVHDAARAAAEAWLTTLNFVVIQVSTLCL